MHVLVGLALALALLYWWLLGHWFARVVMFLVLIPALGLCLAMLMASAINPGPSNGAFGFLLGAALAWPASGVPVYYWRARIREVERA